MKLKIALIEYDICWENPMGNFKYLDSLIPYLSDCSVVLLPEMYSTGFSMNVNKVAEDSLGESYQFLVYLSQKTGAAVTASIPTIGDNGYYNRLYFVNPKGEFHTYDKRHLFSYGRENEFYQCGKERKIINYENWRIMPQICYDLRFPVFTRNRDEYEILYYVANWPKSRIYMWDSLLKARAIENQSYVIGVNRIGVDGNGLEYNGCSMVYNALGEKIEPEKPHPSVLRYELDFSGLRNIRDKFPFLRDLDKFDIEF